MKSRVSERKKERERKIEREKRDNRNDVERNVKLRTTNEWKREFEIERRKEKECRDK